MSRPPYPHPAGSTGLEQTGDLRRLDYLPLEYADLLALEEELAVAELERPLPQADGGVEEADVARTFMELSALVGHVLSAYQRVYAGEAFISTATAASSLVRHAHRLAYDPDPGIAAGGYVVLFTKDAVAGTVAAGLPLASAPIGDIKAQDYETLDDLVVDAALNAVVPVEALKTVELTEATQELRIAGVGHGLAAGEVVAVVADKWRGFVVTGTREEADTGTTVVGLDTTLGFELVITDPPPVLLARPSLSMRPFGTDADPALYPPSELKSAGYLELDTGYWYSVDAESGTGDVYLSGTAPVPLVGGHVVRRSDRAVFQVVQERLTAATFNRKQEETFKTYTVALKPTTGTTTAGGFTSELKDEEKKLLVSTHISGAVTAVELEDDTGDTRPRADHPIPEEWLAGWTLELPLAASEPNPEPAEGGLKLPGVLAALVPGRPLVFRSRDGTRVQVVTVSRVEIDEANAVTRVWWDPVTEGPAGGWPLDQLLVFANVVRVSHGRTVDETLGGSDGVTPFQRFELRESPLTFVPGVAGGEPELEVRVDDVLWQRVQDFADSGPDDRHYRIVTDSGHVTSVVFGDGRNGAVPPSGRKNVAAVYRVGIGRAGDVEAGRLTRLKRAHPLLDRVENMTAVSGGAEPADAGAIRAQATRWIRTFDRAVSVSDLADLALTMPGIARAASRWDQAAGAIVVVATAAGETPSSLDAVRAFLDARRDVTVPLELRGPRPRDVVVHVTLEPDPAYLVELVKDAVRAALYGVAEDAPGMFTFPARGLGQPAFRSEVYERLETVPGVIGVTITRFNSSGGDEVLEVVTADVDEWLRLPPTGLTLTIAGATV